MSAAFVALDYFRANKEAMRILQSAFREVVVAEKRAEAFKEFKRIRDHCSALIIGTKELITDELLEACPVLRTIGTLSAGIDHIDTALLERRGISLVTAKGVNAHAVAEHILMFILCILKRTFAGHNVVLQKLDRDCMPERPKELKGQRVGIIGAGDTAQALAKCLQPFFCEISAWTRKRSDHSRFFCHDIKYKNLDRLFTESDIISLNVPLCADTEGLVNYQRLMEMPQNGILVNIGRKRLINSQDLKIVLDRRPDLRFAFDESSLWEEPYFDRVQSQVIFSPHVAGFTGESSNAMGVHIAQRIAQMLCQS